MERCDFWIQPVSDINKVAQKRSKLECVCVCALVYLCVRVRLLGAVPQTRTPVKGITAVLGDFHGEHNAGNYTRML